MSATNSKGGCIILLDVPPGSAITIDGVTRVTPPSSSTSSVSSSPSCQATTIAGTPLDRGIFIVNDIPSSSLRTSSGDGDNNALFHLLVVRCGLATSKTGSDNGNGVNGGDCRTLPVGFVLSGQESTSASAKMKTIQPSQTIGISNVVDVNEVNDKVSWYIGGYEWIFARKYDPQTEEISNEPLDSLTVQNLVLAMGYGGELAHCIFSYDQFMGLKGAEDNRHKWMALTQLIDASFLHRRHNLKRGDKIVPSSEPNEAMSHPNANNTGAENTGSDADMDKIADGKSITYPAIPCIDTTINARRMTQHAGTRKYLSELSPEERTWLLIGGAAAPSMPTTDPVTSSMSNEGKSPGEFVWNDILQKSYNNIESDLLADIQLSFLLFLFLECHSSMENWRDAISMCSLSLAAQTTNSVGSSHEKEIESKRSLISRQPQFFLQLLTTLQAQLSCIETEFFQEVEYSSGENNFLIGALQRICNTCDGSDMKVLEGASMQLRKMVWDRFQISLPSLSMESMPQNGSNGNGDNEMEMDLLEPLDDESRQTDIKRKHANGVDGVDGNCWDDAVDDEDDDEDGPVIIPLEQVEASLARSSQNEMETTPLQKHQKLMSEEEKLTEKNSRTKYPLLYGAISPQEDVLMACARILGDANDVSLVREAAAYLEEVEAQRNGE